MDNRDNKNKVFLAHLPQWNIEQPPLGIAYLAAYARSYGYEVVQKDYSIELYSRLPTEKKHLLESSFHIHWISENDYREKVYPEIRSFLEGWVLEMALSDAAILGFTMLSTNRLPVLQVVQQIKQRAPEKIIIIGGPEVSRYNAAGEIIANDYVDFVVPGEGEEAFGELLDALSGKKELAEVKGIIYKNRQGVFDSGERPLIKNLDDLPFPSLQDYGLELYPSLIIPILGSRGCINRCSFCSERVFWSSYRSRSGGSLFDEIKYHCQAIGPRYFYIADSLINGNISELEKLCDLLINEGMKINWGGKAAIRRQMSEQLLKKMRLAGCSNLDYGIESGSSKVLREMNKSYSSETASLVLKNSFDAGIKSGLFWIIGFPTESDDDFRESMLFLKKHVKYIDHVTPGYGCGIQPGSELYNHPEKFGIYWKDGDWFSEYTTPQARQERIKAFKDFCYSLGVPVH